MTVLRFEDAAVRVGGRLLWEHLSTAVEPGAFVAVLGPNGAGKSTLLKAVLGSQPLAEGRLEVVGSSAGSRTEGIGYLPQRRTFEPDVRVRGRDIVRLGLDGERWGLPLPRWTAPERDARQRVDEVIELVGASAYADRGIGETSGGEQQRLLIAQAIVRKPKLLLLDEPLDSLDLAAQQDVANLIARISRELGMAVVMVAHDVNPILAHLHHVIYVANGRALAGDPQDVITTDALSELYDTPVEVLRAGDGRLVVVGGGDVASFHGHG